ncbi:MAG: hypothetical protein FJ267_19330 [Planctomycetes bacterium]|nr:hypothetical protein [Planctomycetota bacterium]
MPDTFTDEELHAYVNEDLSVERATVLEQQLRQSPLLLDRLAAVVRETETNDESLGGMWRRGRWSCPSRSILAAYVNGRLGDGFSQFIEFHTQVTGCRFCQANLEDLRTSTSDAEMPQRVHRIFQSSAGHLNSTTPQ